MLLSNTLSGLSKGINLMKTRKAFFQENPPEVNFILYPSTTQPFLFKEKERPLKKKEREEERAL